MSIYYPSGCASGAVPDYYCAGCLDASVIEYGRVRSVAFIKNTYIDTVLANPTSSSVWSTGVNSGDIIVIYQTQGTYDVQTSELPGFGDSATYNGNTTHTLTYKDPFPKENIDFYNALKGSTDYTVAFRTSSTMWYAEEPVTITPKIAVPDDLNAALTVEVAVKWISSDIPTTSDVPAGTFTSCYINS